MTDFAVCPGGGKPPRLFRFDIEDPEVLAILDPEANVLRINKALYDRLTNLQQWEVMKTRHRMITAA